MITPKFELTQTETHIVILIHAPYTSVKDTEIDVNEDSVIFHSSPYYLRLTLPGKVEETDDSSADYNADDGKYTISLNKVVRGQHFPNLEMLTTLLQPKNKKQRIKPLIEVIGEDGVKENSCTVDDISEDDWFIEQTPMEEEMSTSTTTNNLLNKHPYGFLNSHSGLQDKYSEELAQVSEIRNPDSCSERERRALRLQEESSKFSDDHYLADFMENEEVALALQFQFDASSLTVLTQKNKEKMKDLGNREFLVDKTSLKKTYLGLVDILYAYCYDWRITEGGHCCESPWNISRLSATLSWFDSFESIHEVIHSCIRRSLVYPVSRHWMLSRKVMKDVIKVLKSGPIGILVCLLDILDIFGKKEPYYLLNQLYIEEYCVWIQQIGPSSSSSQSNNLASIVIALEKAFPKYKKEHVGFDLNELEAAATVCEEEEAMEEEISHIVRNVTIN